jgi:CRISPR type III-A-associated protein Csm2
MDDDIQQDVTPSSESPAGETAAPEKEASKPAEGPSPEIAAAAAAIAEALKGGGARTQEAAKREGRPQGQGPQQRREDRPPRGESRGGENRERKGGPRGEGNRPEGNRAEGARREGGPRGEGGRGEGHGRDRGERREGRPGSGFRPDFNPEIELDKLIADSLYLDNQAHAVVARMRDMDSGTKSQLRRLYNAVRRAVRAPEGDRQHQFVMLRARLAYTIARHSLRSLDALERLLLQVTRKNDVKGYERFKDLFEAIVAYNE